MFQDLVSTSEGEDNRNHLEPVVLGAWAAAAQKDLKRIFAYSSINHLGYCVLGILVTLKWTGASLASERAAALNGVFLQIFNHALTGSS